MTRALSLAWLGLVAFVAPAAALEVPARTDRYVNDYAGILPAGEEAELERYLAEFDRTTSNQIVVVTLADLEGLTAEEVTLRYAEAWKPGQADKDNGVVVGVFPNDRQARIEVGYGLEGAIPDATANTIMRHEMIPRFRTGDWAGGITAGVRALSQAAAGEYNEPAPQQPQLKLRWWMILLLMFGVWAVLFFFGTLGGAAAYGPGYRRRGGWGGPWGGGGGWRGGGGGFGGGFGGGGGGFGGGGASGRW